jgi:hypothetical protein
MKTRFRIGLLVGLVGLFVNIAVAAIAGLCGPVVSLIGGAVAGYLTAQREKHITKNAGAQAGAISGAVAGALILIGQVIGAVGALMYIQQSGTQIPFGTIPPPSADMGTQLTYYLSGLVAGVCFGVVGVVVAALAGAGAGFLRTPEPGAQPASTI